MLVDGGDETFFLAGQRVPNRIGSGGRTGVVIESPGEISGTGDVAGEVHHIIIRHGAYVRLAVHPLLGLEVGITTGVAHTASGHVAQGGMVGNAQCHPFVECGSDE